MSDRPTANLMQRLTALRRSGGIARMSGKQAKALLAFLTYADNQTAQGHPGLDTLAKDIGDGNPNRVRAALQELEELGVMRTVDAGGGRGCAAVREICNGPETGTQAVLASSPNTTTERGTKTVPLPGVERGDRFGPPFGRKGGPK